MPRLHEWSVLLLAFLPLTATAQTKPRFVARLTDGTWLEGNQLANWYNSSGTPQLEGRKLLDSKNPFRWLRDRTLFPQRKPSAFIETTTGDLVPGEIVGYSAGGSRNFEAEPAHLVLQPQFPMRPRQAQLEPKIRIKANWVRRIVWQRRSREYRPGTLIFRDGRMLKFRTGRFSPTGIRMLTTKGARSVGFREIAELHLPETDNWQTLLDELAILDAKAKTRLIQYETVTGLRVTTSLNRLTPTGQGSNLENWVHGLQPAWSLDVLWLPNSDIWVRRSFAANEVPVTRLRPSSFQSRSMITGASIPWQSNRNVLGGPLRSAGKEFGWGLGVHAMSNLSYSIPPFVTAIRTSVGLDRSAGSRGGCVQARLLLKTADGKTTKLFESPMLVGSKQVVDSPRVVLPLTKSATRTLQFYVDPAHKGRPAGADPFDIRDMTNWLTPVFELDQNYLASELPRRVPRHFATWQHWVVQTRQDSPFGRPSAADGTWQLDTTAEPLEAFRFRWNNHKQFWTMSRSVDLQPHHKWLLIRATHISKSGPPPQLQVRLNNELIRELAIPRHSTRPTPVAIPLHSFHISKERTVQLELSMAASDSQSSLHWYDIRLAQQSPHIYELLEDAGQVAAIAKPASGDGGGGPATFAKWHDADRYSGSRAVRLTTNQKYQLKFAPLPIRSSPRLGEFRYLRFAFRKRGAGRWGVRLRHTDEFARPASYDAGRGKPLFDKAKRVVAKTLPDEWVVVTRDLYQDFGQFDLTALEFDVPDGHSLLLDHIYLAPASASLDSVPVHKFQPRILSGHKAAIEKVRKSIVAGVARIRTSSGHTSCGVCISSSGEILAPASMLVGLRKVQVTFASGIQAVGSVLGIDRETNTALIQVKSKTPLPFVPIKSVSQLSSAAPLIAPTVDHGPATPRVNLQLSQLIHSTRSVAYVVPQLRTTIGPLFDSTGSLVAMVIGSSRFRGTRFALLSGLAKKLVRLRKKETIGRWIEGGEPTTGIQVSMAKSGCVIGSILAKGTLFRPEDSLLQLGQKKVPNARAWFQTLAQLDPTAKIPVTIRRNGKLQTIQLQLTPNNPQR